MDLLERLGMTLLRRRWPALACIVLLLVPGLLAARMDNKIAKTQSLLRAVLEAVVPDIPGAPSATAH